MSSRLCNRGWKQPVKRAASRSTSRPHSACGQTRCGRGRETGSPEMNDTQTTEQFANAVAAYLIGDIHQIAPPVLLAHMMEAFPIIIKDELEAYLANRKMQGERKAG